MGWTAGAAAGVLALVVAAGPAGAAAPATGRGALAQEGGLAAQPGPDVVRRAGPDRYATAARIVHETFTSTPVPVAFVAAGDRSRFPDALAGGPAADVLGGPLLLVQGRSVPAATRAELERLQPERIVVLGGSAAVGEAVLEELRRQTPGAVTRLAGADRYGTAAQVALHAFSGGVRRVLIATGTEFPDALAAGAVGAATDSPVLLVSRDRVPDPTAEALRALRPRDITVLGGPAAVSDAVLAELRTYIDGGADRVSGASRYDTAALAAQVFWPDGAAVAYLSSGQAFPDGLAGAPAAGRDRAPLLLTEPSCLPAATQREIERLRSTSLVVLGGTAAVSDAAASGRALCAERGPVRTDFTECLGLPSDPAACTEVLPPE